MPSAKEKPSTIAEYLASVKPDQQAALEKLRQAIHAVAPGAKERISYGLPAFRLNGRSLVFFGAWANHCAFYPGSSTTLKEFKNDLEGFRTSKGTVHFSPDKPLPMELVKTRMAENRR
jgi:uncharacterized protein YdhG (YjbR/CyaY superfamily)